MAVGHAGLRTQLLRLKTEGGPMKLNKYVVKDLFGAFIKLIKLSSASLLSVSILLQSFGCQSKLNVAVKTGSAPCKSQTGIKKAECNNKAVTVKIATLSPNTSTVTGAFTVTAVFSVAVSDFIASDIAATNARVTKIESSDNITFTVDVTPANAGTLSLYIPKDVATSADQTPNTASDVLTLTYAPVVSSNSGSSTNSGTTSSSQAPVMAALTDFTIPYNTSSYTVDLVVTDVDSSLTCDASSLSVTSSNESIISSSSITWSGTAPACVATIQPTANSTGNATLTFTIQDPTGSASSKSVQATVSSALTWGSTSLSYVDRLRRELYSPWAVSVFNGKMYVADQNYGRVQVWNSVPTSSFVPADGSLGGGSPGTIGIGTNGSAYFYDRYSFSIIMDLFIDGSKIFTLDGMPSRITIRSASQSDLTTAPTVVVGQTDFSAINFGGVSSQSFMLPRSVFSDGTRLLLADGQNDRVLIWNTIPTTNNQAADIVVGQNNLSTGTSQAASSSGLINPGSAIIYQGKLIVADSGNNRVLIWNSIPTANMAPANVVIGQTNLTGVSANAGGSAAADTLSGPQRLFAADGKLFISDYGNNRVLIYNTIPTSNRPSANTVVGQTSFSSASANQGTATPSGSSLSNPMGLWVDSGKLFVADSGNSRVLIWNGIPATHGAAADVVVGSPNATTVAANISVVATRVAPSKTHICGTKMFAADPNRNRVLVWNNFSTIQSNSAPDIVLGQSSFTTATANAGGVSASTMSGPADVFCDGTRLFVADSGNNRVLEWTSLPTTSGQAANVVIGQANMTSNSSGTTAATLTTPKGVWSTGSVLFVADYGNSRVLKYNTIPSSNGASANIVMGQSNMTSGSTSCAAGGMSYPSAINVIGSKLLVADTQNRRVLIWNSIPGSSGLPADVVVGAPNAVTCTGGLSASMVGQVYGLASDGTKLYVSDSTNSRILTFNSIPTSHGQSASSVTGQSNFTNGNPNAIVLDSPRGSLSASTFYCQQGLDLSGGYLYISDTNNQRLIAVPAP
jgi:hypothetical protein